MADRRAAGEFGSERRCRGRMTPEKVAGASRVHRRRCPVTDIGTVLERPIGVAHTHGQPKATLWLLRHRSSSSCR
jgi:hypothetical protein